MRENITCRSVARGRAAVLLLGFSAATACATSTPIRYETLNENWRRTRAIARPADAGEFQAPARFKTQGKPIDAPMGNAAPCYGDFDGDGVKDLLVGQFEDGKLKIYRNLGTNRRPKFLKSG